MDKASGGFHSNTSSCRSFIRLLQIEFSNKSDLQTQISEKETGILTDIELNNYSIGLKF